MDIRTVIDLTQALLAKFPRKSRKLGKFNVSDAWGITHGYLTPEKYFNGEDIGFEAAFRMWQGTHKHAQIEELLKDIGYETEVRAAYRYSDEWEIVGKCDGKNKEGLLELKSSEHLMDRAKSWHLHQGKIYCTLFELPSCTIVQPVVKDGKLVLLDIGREERDDAWFQKQMKLLDAYYKKLVLWTQSQ